jgi:D-inositol-3-phosphate glycosyltransferase
MKDSARPTRGGTGERAGSETPGIVAALLTGGGDRPYAFGLGTELMSKRVALDVIAGDDLECEEFHKPGVRFLNLRGSQDTRASLVDKMFRVLAYYVKLICYAATARPKLFHILWNNKFQTFDRTLLMLYYKLLGKSTVLTVHNVNIGKRDSKNTSFSRWTLRIQYHLADHLFVHTDRMKSELIQEFDVPTARITVIPFGLNNSVPDTVLTPAGARKRLGIRNGQKTILFFGNIAPYKGLEYLIAAFQRLVARDDDYFLVIAGRPKNCEEYWASLREEIEKEVRNGRVLLRPDYISDEETEIYFKAADVLALPYRYVYQSGVLFLGYRFGLPVLAADVGSLREEVVEGKTGFVFAAEDSVDFARAIETYFASDLFADLDNRRKEIQGYAAKKHSWDIVGQLTLKVYADLLQLSTPKDESHCESNVFLD